MYVHAGEDVMIRSSEIIAILEKETAKDSQEIQTFLDKKNDLVINLANGAFKSLIITEPHIYLSPIAPGTLKKRLMNSIGHELII
ncbi:extracellular matrix regulator RemB [Lederbergia citrea]|uniref:extracellular matrix regulator RemB n=1 Tax=Lederbergia citrea TaxID=2833581 RepID=UPI001BC90027|nr:extracellular matrix/biofilm biosynthesis regulator RemA family protein [Lederbergia citrea]MBS4177598.1 DUF370 domain-containing protein [Lederbergia citrea]MBS4204271.1 DUF370 domain-containing protein [Lederbergia citrea]